MNKKINFGTISTILGIISLGWLAILTEDFISPLGWVIHLISAVTGAIYLYRKKEKPILFMYVSLLIFDMIAVIRLVM